MKLEHAPRLVLGMPSYTPNEDATVAFAKASRRLKGSDEAPFDIKDLTAALSQLEGHVGSDLTFEFKVPASRQVVELGAEAFGGDAGAHSELTRALDLLFQWKWAESVDAAKEVLRATDREDLRDEALNVIAAASAMSGDTAAALSALKQAVQGEWNFELQQNLGILALGEDPDLAAEQSTYWLDAAGSREDRERALFYVMSMWSSLEHEDRVELPTRIRDSFRSALSEDLSIETFALLGLFLARNDSEWAASPANWIRSPHSATDVAGLVMARAEGFESFIDFLVENATNQTGEVARAREGFISELIDVMFDDEPAMWAASLAMGFVDRGLPCDSLNNALLRLLAIREISIYFRTADGEPKDDFINWLVDVDAYLKTVTDEELRNYIRGMLASSTTLFMLVYISARDTELDHMAEPLQMIHSMSQSWMTRRRLNKPQARSLAQSTLEWANETGQMIAKFRRLPLPDAEAKEFLDDLARRQGLVLAISNETLRNL